MNTTREKVHPTTKKPTSTTIIFTNNGPVGQTTTVKAAMTTPTATTTTTAASPKLSAVKAQQFPAAPRYRPRPPPSLRDDHRRHQRRRRRCCTCRCCFLTIWWVTLIMIAFLALAAVTATMFYAVYHPQLPEFSLFSLKFAPFDLSSAQFISTTKINLTMRTKNPNDKITFFYNPINITVLAPKRNIEIGQGSFPAFVHHGKNITILTATVKSNNVVMDDSSFGILKNDLNKQKGLDLKVNIETEVRVKIGNKVKTNKVVVKVTCGGVKVHGSKNGNFTDAIVDNIKGKGNCNVHFFIKLFDWDIPI